MKKILVVIASFILLASCGNKTPETETATGNTVATTTGTIDTPDSTQEKPLVLTADENISGPAVATGSKIELRYILRIDNENGEVKDTNVSTGSEEKPTFDITVGETSLIKGFEEALIGMRAGEVKSFVVSPENGYGTGSVTQELSLEQVAPEFVTTAPLKGFNGIITETREISKLRPDEKAIIDSKNVWDVLEENEHIKVILKEKNDTNITIELHALQHPFYNKKIVVGTEASEDGTTAKIEKIENDTVTIRMITDKNPFTKETFKVGSTGKLQIPTQFGHIHETEITILEIGDKVVKVSTPNTHELANKNLHFTVKVLKIEENPTTENLQ